ncbi:Ig-like domain-containing protein [Variovorax sp. J22R133]|uniref:cadherin-like domain-containing protein n=1 Tax=Variovorax brevis TaxID=3053503 RepID=UPI0025763B2B|nr:Ig-like domain-containing protein [Variovorax sp. J22R133]MDM0114961.1 Ig-like domain-containing protein [Variovorax sp. J22R133]
MTVFDNGQPIGEAPVGDDGTWSFANAPITVDVLPPPGIDADGDALSVTQFSVDHDGNPATPPAVVTVPPGGTSAAQPITDAAGHAVGSVTMHADGTLTFTAAPGWHGPVPDVTYTVTDGSHDVEGTLGFADVPNNPPVLPLIPDAATLANQPITVDVLPPPGTDADGDVLSVTQFSVDHDGNPATPPALVTVPRGGTSVAQAITDSAGHPVGSVTMRFDGTLTFTAAPGYHGQVPDVRYTVSDGTHSVEGGVGFVDVPDNAPALPVIADATTQANQPTTVDVLPPPGTDADGDVMSVTQFSVDADGDPATAPVVVTVPSTGSSASLPISDAGGHAIGELTMRADGTLTFTPVPGFHGAVPDVTYTVTDGTHSVEGVVGFSDVPNNAPVLPVIADATTQANQVNTVDVLPPPGTDADGDVLSVTQFSVDHDGNPLTTEVVVTVPSGSTSVARPITDADGHAIGELTMRADGLLTFTAAPGYHGPVSDGITTVTATLRLNVDAVNDAPVVPDTTIDVPGGEPSDVPADEGLLADARDIDGDALAIVSFTIGGIAQPFAAGTVADIPGVGALTIHADGSYRFVPASGYSGAFPAVTFVISDGHGGIATGELSLNVVAPPAEPADDVPVHTDFVFVARPDDDPQRVATGDATLRVHGAVLGAVAALGGPPASVTLGAHGVVLAAVDGVAPLNGTTLPTPHDALGASAGFNAVSHASSSRTPIDRLHASLFNEGHQDPLSALSTGASLRLFAAPGKTDVVLQMQVSDGRAWIGVDDIDSRHSPIRRVDVTLADGRPLPRWIHVDASGLILVEAPAGTERIGLRITVIRHNGEARSHTVDIDIGAGELHERSEAAPNRDGRRADAGQHADARDFASQLARAHSRPSTVDVELWAALS